MSRRFEVKVDIPLVVNRFIKLNSPGSVAEMRVTMMPLIFEYRVGSILVLWETPFYVPGTFRHYWVDMCGLAYEPFWIQAYTDCGELREMDALKLPPSG